MQQGLQIVIHQHAPQQPVGESGPPHATPRPGFEPYRDAPVEVPFEEVPDETAAPVVSPEPADPDAARRQRDADDYAAAVQRALQILAARGNPKPPFATGTGE